MAYQEDVVYLTAEGLQKIKDELAYLQKEKTEEIANKLSIAIAQGDLKENADYHAAKEEQAFVEGRIRDLEYSLRHAKIIKDTGPSDVVRVGNTVTLLDTEYDEEMTYTIVGAHEANPSKGLISNESPIGKALIGAKKGTTVTANTPAGEIQLTIKKIE